MASGGTRRFRSITAVVLLGLGAAAGVVGLGLRRRFVVVAVSGESMTPTYAEGDRVLVRRAPVAAVRSGQVVVMEAPDVDGAWTTPALDRRIAARRWIIKRALAVPGDPLPREHVPAIAANPEDVVPAERLVVVGDAERSFDSRAFGYAPAERVLGVVVRRFATGARS